MPNEYLHYYYFAREAVVAGRTAARTRGALLLEQQRHFYDSVRRDPGSALSSWESTLAEREATYGADNRAVAGMGSRDSCDLDAGGYEGMALALMRAISRDEGTSLILNVRNRSTLDVLDADAVVEVPCVVDAAGPRPHVVGPLPDFAVGLVCEVKAVERAVIDAAVHGSRSAAVKALAIHPLVDSVNVAHRILDGYVRRIPELAYLRP